MDFLVKIIGKYPNEIFEVFLALIEKKFEYKVV